MLSHLNLKSFFTPFVLLSLLMLLLSASAFFTLSSSVTPNSFDTAEPADLIIINGDVWTADEDKPRAEAVAIKGNRIVAVGSNHEIEEYRYSHTRVIDAEGHSVLPGFIDNHTHFDRAGQLLMGINLLDVNDTDGLRRELTGAVERLPDLETWITGGMWGAYAQWERDSDGRVDEVPSSREELWRPNLEMVDDLTPDTPILLSKWDNSLFLVNSRAIELAELDCTQEGVLCEDGQMTGLLLPDAASAVRDRVPPPSFEHRLAEARLALDRLLQHGVTTIHDNTPPGQMRVFQSLKEKGELTTRIYARPTLDKWESLSDVGITHGFGDHWLRIGGLKGFVDGIMGNSSARFYEPYLHTGERGIWRDMMYPPGNMKKLITEADAAGHWPQVHAIGDQAVDSLITLFEHAIDKNGFNENRRFRMIHTQVLRDASVAEQLADLGIIAEMQPYHAIDDMRWMEERIGERSRWAYAFNTLHEAGVTLSFGSDWPGTNASWYTSNPLHGIYAAVSRKTLDGNPPGGWYPEERIDLETALKAYTINNAFAEGQESVKGSISPGKLADLVILSENLLDADVTQYPEINVRYTIVDGILHPITSN